MHLLEQLPNAARYAVITSCSVLAGQRFGPSRVRHPSRLRLPDRASNEERCLIVTWSDWPVTLGILCGVRQVTVKNLLGQPEDPSGMGLTTFWVCT